MIDIEKSLAESAKTARQPHQWVPSTLNHGELQCKLCRMTNREALVLGPDCPEDTSDE